MLASSVDNPLSNPMARSSSPPTIVLKHPSYLSDPPMGARVGVELFLLHRSLPPQSQVRFDLAPCLLLRLTGRGKSTSSGMIVALKSAAIPLVLPTTW